jgi:2-methylcitrate dehydratase
VSIHERLDPADVLVRVEVRTFGYAVNAMAGEADKWHPATRETADHSLPFLVASAIVRGTVDLATFDDDGLTNPSVRALLDVVEDDACNQGWPEATPVRMAATLASGATLYEEADHHRGNRLRPLSDDEVVAKFEMLAEPTLGHDRYVCLERVAMLLPGSIAPIGRRPAQGRTCCGPWSWERRGCR